MKKSFDSPSEVDGNVAGSHEQTHVDLLNASRLSEESGRRGKKRSRKRRRKKGHRAAQERAAHSEVNGNVDPSDPKRTGGFVHDERNPVIPPELDLPTRRSDEPRRPSHQPAALSTSGRRFQVGPED